MQEPEELQKLRQKLRQFRQVTATRERDEKTLASEYSLEKIQNDQTQENTKQSRRLQKAHTALTLPKIVESSTNMIHCCQGKIWSL